MQFPVIPNVCEGSLFSCAYLRFLRFAFGMTMLVFPFPVIPNVCEGSLFSVHFGDSSSLRSVGMTILMFSFFVIPNVCEGSLFAVLTFAMFFRDFLRSFEMTESSMFVIPNVCEGSLFSCAYLRFLLFAFGMTMLVFSFLVIPKRSEGSLIMPISIRVLLLNPFLEGYRSR